MNFSRIDNGHHIDIDSGVEYQSTWRFCKNYNIELNDMLVLSTAKRNGVSHYKLCPIEFEKAREIYGDFVYMYPVVWLKEKFLTKKQVTNNP
ncbi:hypothetical protein [Aeromonas dhakensis]|uniref:hypothetical protein n=1 Tax=Aeromonas dhakensis TaxID=196024 RepID=UPI002442C79F|nr:hypothetical protein [Aeromonas dhakensis]